MDDQLKQDALDFHGFPVPGKIQVSPTKPLTTQRDLAPAYSPGVAVPCLETEKDPLETYKCTARGNLAAVISNGTAVLGLGNISALTGKPMMEGKDIPFKKFTGIDVFDVEADELNSDKFVEVVAALELTSGGISFEDIKAPECFYIEQKLREQMDTPVSHDDQHGTAIISTAAILNDLHVMEKNTPDVRMVVFGAGAAAIACMNLLVVLGLQKHNIVVCDSKDIIYQGREPNMAETKAACTVVDDGKHTLDDMIEDADIFLGCSGPKVLTQGVAKKTARASMILAPANPEPEILPPLVKEVCPNAIICTGRSDYPGQINNVLCFPFILRSALDAGITVTNEEMKLVAVCVIAELIHAEQSEVVALAYGGQDPSFDPGYIIPKPSDPRLIIKIAPAVAKAAMESGVTTCPIAGFDTHANKLTEFAHKTSLFVKPIFSQAHKAPKHIVLLEGEETRVLHAIQELVTLGPAKPTLIGRPSVTEVRIQKLGLQTRADVDFKTVNNESDPCFKEYWAEYFQIMKHRDVTQGQAQRALISNPTVIGAIVAQCEEADAMTCGAVGDYHEHSSVVKNVFGYRGGVHAAGTMNALLLPNGNAFITDTYVNDEPDAREPAEVTLMAAETVRRFDIEPCVTLLSHFNFGSFDCPSSSKIRQALKLVRDHAPDLMIDGEMHGDAALVEAIRNDCMPDNPLKGSANILMMPNMEAARINYSLLRVPSPEGATVGPVLMGTTKPVHVLAPIASVRRIVNMVALAVVEAQTQPL